MGGPFASCQAFFRARRHGRLGPTPKLSGLLPALLAVTEANSLNHLVVPNQRPVRLLTGVLAKAITRVHSKLNQPSVDVLAVFPEVDWLRVTLPFDFRALGIEQHSLEPVPDSFFVVLRIRSAKSRINILPQDGEGKKANQEKSYFHNSRKSKMTGLVDKKSRAFFSQPLHPD